MFTPREILNSVFGHEEFRGEQEAAIDALVEGRDVILVAATGGGKSLAYQIPAMVSRGVGVVVSPLRALIKDQVEKLHSLNVPAAAIDGEVRGYDRVNVLNAARDGRLDLLYVTPEMLAQPRFLETLKEVEVSLFAIDEAHAASQWGHDFRPDYRILGLLPHHFPGVPRIAVTATADPATLSDMKETLALRDALVLSSSLERANIRVSVEQRESLKSQKAKILDLVRARSGQSGLVYCIGKNTVDKVAQWLASENVRALPYHAGLPSETRERHQDAFVGGEVDVLVCTVAFGMGVDKSDVRYVIHHELPGTIEAYEQEIGRAGRDGNPAEAFMFAGNGDIAMRKRMIRKSAAGAASKRTESNKFDLLVGYAETLGCRRRAVMTYFGKTMPNDCGACDNCRTPREGDDAGPEARAILDILANEPGGLDARSLEARLAELDEFAARDAAERSMVIRQTLVLGLVEMRHAGMGRLHPTEAGRSFSATDRMMVPRRVGFTSACFASGGGTKPSASKPRTAGTRPGASRQARPRKRGDPLLEALRRLRNKIAREERRPRYYVVHDSALREMAAAKPLSGDELMAINGIGEAKIASYGHHFIDVIRRHAA